MNLHPEFEQNHSEAELAQIRRRSGSLKRKSQPHVNQHEKNPYLRSNNCSISLKS